MFIGCCVRAEWHLFGLTNRPRSLPAVCPTQQESLLPSLQKLMLDSFRRHYHRHLPIVDVQKSMDTIFCDSAFLFWAIVITAAQYHPVHSGQFHRLGQPFKRLVADHLVHSIRSIYTIQALLLLIVWPFPVLQQDDDPSWNYCGIAVSATLKMGFDDTNRNNMSDSMIQRTKTWLGCFAVSTA